MYHVSFILYSIICRCCLNICLETRVVIHIYTHDHIFVYIHMYDVCI